MSDYSRWRDTIEKHDKEDGICPLLDDVYEQGKVGAIDELFNMECSDVPQDECDAYCPNCFQCKWDRIVKKARLLKEQS